MKIALGVTSRLLFGRVFSQPTIVRCGPAVALSRRLCSSGSSGSGSSIVTGEGKPRPSDDVTRAPSMLRHLTSKIKATGPITVAEYMREVLTNPVTGYYVKNDMLGPDGDFITSPEISQIFGELLGVWVLSEWMGAGRPKQLQMVELGPGRGSLASDILRVFSQLGSVLGDASVSVHLVEVSRTLSHIQAHTLTGSSSSGCHDDGAAHTHTHTPEEEEEEDPEDPVYRRGRTSGGLPVAWYRCLDDVPKGFSIFLAHEFFDALPIHKFQRTERGWREVLVDIDPEKDDQLRFVLARAPTIASSTLIQTGERRGQVEVCAEGGVIVQKLANRIAADGGAALIADYGHDGTKTDTFRGFKGHRLHDVLSSPGTADLTADVDFSYLRRVAEEVGGASGGRHGDGGGRHGDGGHGGDVRAEEVGGARNDDIRGGGDEGEGGVVCLGPVTQRTFLKNMGIDSRMQVLLRNCTVSHIQSVTKVLLRNCTEPSTRKQLISSYDMLTNPERMGERFHFFSLLPSSRLRQPTKLHGLQLEKKKSPKPLPVAGFTELTYT